MPIVGLTDNIEPRFQRLGKLRKGGERTPKGFGPDLDHFRFTSDRPEIVKAFVDAFGDKPRALRVFIPHQTPEAAFATWSEVWGTSGLVHRCDGETMTRWREGDKYISGRKPCPGSHTKGDYKRDAVGRLEVIIPELIQAGFVGYVTLETHSINDIAHIAAVLENVYGRNDLYGRHDLRGVEFVLRRALENIGVPGWGDRAGDRSRANKWLVKIEPAPDWVRLQLESARAQAMMLPTPQAIVDQDTGEILDRLPEPVIDDAQQHTTIEVETAQVPTAMPELAPAVEQPAPKPAAPAPVKPGKLASIAPGIKARFDAAIEALAREFPYFANDAGKPNPFRVTQVAGLLHYTLINESNLDALMNDLKQHAREQTQEVPF